MFLIDLGFDILTVIAILNVFSGPTDEAAIVSGKLSTREILNRLGKKNIKPPRTPRTPTSPKRPTDSRFRIDEPLNPTGRNMGQPQPSRGPGMRDKWEGPLSNSYEPNHRKKILSEIRKPVKVKEAPTKYKMNFSGKFSPQNTPDKTSSHLSDELAMRANARGQSWRTSDKYWSGYETTEKLNIIQDRVGHGSQAWDMIVEKNADKKGWRDREIQENLNQIAHEKAMLNENPLFESPFIKSGMDIDPTTPKNKKNFDKVNKIKRVMADKNTQKMMSQVAPEYPSNPVPQPDEVTGLNPKLQSGENAAAYYKRLDPISANSMPDAAYPQIDYLKNKSKRLKGFKKFKEEKISKES
jgi:hypothetical protein